MLYSTYSSGSCHLLPTMRKRLSHLQKGGFTFVQVSYCWQHCNTSGTLTCICWTIILGPGAQMSWSYGQCCLQEIFIAETWFSNWLSSLQQHTVLLLVRQTRSRHSVRMTFLSAAIKAQLRQHQASWCDVEEVWVCHPVFSSRTEDGSKISSIEKTKSVFLTVICCL